MVCCGKDLVVSKCFTTGRDLAAWNWIAMVEICLCAMVRFAVADLRLYLRKCVLYCSTYRSSCADASAV
jgi:hypothetical protein